jgi:hypothetical protein
MQAHRKIKFKDLVFYTKKTGDNSFRSLRGLKSDRPGYYHEWTGMNRFSDEAVPVPPGYEKSKRPNREWIKSVMYDPDKYHLEKVTLEQHRNDSWYDIHENGGTPFIVYINRQKTLVSVYRKPQNGYVWDEEWSRDMKDNLGFYSELVAEYRNPLKVLLGKDEQYTGNTILVEHKALQYVYIHYRILEFNTEERITKLLSPIGNSDVPYPVAVSKNHYYFLLDDVILPRSLFVKQKDLYSQFYNLPTSTSKPTFPIAVIAVWSALE